MYRRFLIPLLCAASTAPAYAQTAIEAAPLQPVVVIFAAPPPAPMLLLSPPAPPPEPPKLPESVRRVIDAAIAAGDPTAVAAVVRFTKESNPEVADQIDVIDAGYRSALADRKAREERERIARLEAASFYEMWKGEIELGASRATGNTRNLGLYGAVKAEREGIDWRHKFTARADLQETNKVTTTERINASWQPNYKLDERLYTYGLAQYEHDRFLGYSNRYTAGAGVGYRVLAGPRATLDLEGGPALRHTNFIDEPNETGVAGRASLGFRWKVSPTLQLRQDAALFLESGNNNASATTSLDTKLIGALKARFSYNIQYEPDAPVGQDSLDTLSRATLVYSF